MPQQAADQVHVQPGRIQRHHRESMPRDVHAQGERDSQLPADGVQGKPDGPVPAVDGFFQRPVVPEHEIFRQQIENEPVVQFPRLPSIQDFQGRFRKCPKLSIWDKAFVQVWKEISPETYLLR